MRYIGIDPGNRATAFSILNPSGDQESHLLPNEDILNYFIEFAADPKTQDTRIGIEMIASYGMAVGQTVFETCVFIGRLNEVLKKYDPVVVYRKDVKMHLCHTMKAKDGNIAQALRDLYPATGGGKNPVVGIKSQPGPLFGVAKDMWASLGVAHTARDNWGSFKAFNSMLRKGES